jgi:D-galactose 1-dehydrogenase
LSILPIRIALIGMGKIARDQHVPAALGNAAFALAASVSPHHEGLPGVPHYASIDALFAEGPAVDALALCTPPQQRYDLAVQAIAHGAHVFLEKPPCATLGEIAALECQAAAAGVTLFASWHSRYAAGVAPARAWLAEREVRSARIVWREDVRVWHPGQAWIWEPGGFGVFDPGINALSIATHILPRPILLADACLNFPRTARRRSPPSWRCATPRARR